jgi:hypothetical protein
MEQGVIQAIEPFTSTSAPGGMVTKLTFLFPPKEKAGNVANSVAMKSQRSDDENMSPP